MKSTKVRQQNLGNGRKGFLFTFKKILECEYLVKKVNGEG